MSALLSSLSVRVLRTQSDARLAELAGQGSERAFQVLVERFRPRLVAHCRRMLLDTGNAEDVVQQSLLSAWSALREGQEVANPWGWMVRIAHNAALDAMKRSGYRYEELHEALAAPSSEEEDLERRIAVRRTLAGLAGLPEGQRQALLHTAVHGMSHAETAQVLRVSEDSVRGLVHRARVTLRSAVTALTPMPLASWAAGAGSGGAPAVAVWAETAAAGGSVGAGILLKGAAVVITVGAVAAGGRAVVHGAHASADRRAHAAARTPAPEGAGAAAVIGEELRPVRARSGTERAARATETHGVVSQQAAPRERAPGRDGAGDRAERGVRADRRASGDAGGPGGRDASGTDGRSGGDRHRGGHPDGSPSGPSGTGSGDAAVSGTAESDAGHSSGPASPVPILGGD